VELLAISIIRRRYMDTPLLKALFGTMIGGLIVFGCGVLIGQS
jgi:erythrin-vacuolar iron transport family protein